MTSVRLVAGPRIGLDLKDRRRWPRWSGCRRPVHLAPFSGVSFATMMLLIAVHEGLVTETFTDALTRLHNRRYFTMRVTEEFDRAKRRKNAALHSGDGLG